MNPKLAAFIDRLPTFPTILIGVWMGLAPFIPEPHLVQKFFMAINGVPFKAIDVFDVFMHGGLAILGVLKIWRVLAKRNEGVNNKTA
ncbi:MAG: hypothetical protein OEL50_03015 [Rhodospirillaceae bacterium]|nr:hypothetical protein [Rhodospirillaceae bacterium]